MQKITYMGQQLWPKQKRDKKGKYSRYNWLMRKVQSVKEWMVWFSIRVGIAGAIAAFGFGMYLMGQFDSNRTIAYASNDMKLDTTPSRVEAMKRELIDNLAKRENEGGVPCYPDDNKAGTLPKKDKVSCGPMAYKVSTVQRHYKECKGIMLSDDDAVKLAMDDERAKELATCAIFDHGHIGEWYGATGEMVTMVRVINKLEK